MPNLLELPDVLRAAGLNVVVLEGYETRTTVSDHPGAAPFHPNAVVWHHDASPAGDSPGVPAFMVRNWASAGAQLWVDRRGTWTVLSCRKANHAGVVLPGMPSNSTSYGVETDHTIGEDWPTEQLGSLRRGTVAILRWLGSAADDLHFHKTICAPVGRKSDPDGLVLAEERRTLRALWTGGPVLPAATVGATSTASAATAAPAVLVQPGARDVAAPPASAGVLVVDGDWGPATTRALQAALGVAVDGVLGPQTYRALQRRCGAAADGVWGPASRRALQAHLHVAVDGVIGPLTVRALQSALNAHTF